jgi:hypothetical protein
MADIYHALNSETPTVDDDEYKMKQLHAQTLEARIEQYRRPRYQNLEAKSKVLIELTKLQLETADDQSKVIDGLTKNLRETNEVGKKTQEELVKLRDETKIDNTKLYCYGFALFCVLLVMILLNWMMNL